jgi:uncharacterized protein DUF6468
MFDLSILTDVSKLLTLPMLFDGGLVVLLAVTLLFVARLNRRIVELKGERAHFDAAIERFAGAAIDTHKAMAELRQMAEGEGRMLQGQVKKGAAIAEDLEFLIGRATSAADRLEAVIGQSRQVEARQMEPRRSNEGRAAELQGMAPAGRDMSAKEIPRTAARDLSKATPLARAIAGDRNDLERAIASRGGPATVTRRPVSAESLPEGERALLKALAGLR